MVGGKLKMLMEYILTFSSHCILLEPIRSVGSLAVSWLYMGSMVMAEGFFFLHTNTMNVLLKFGNIL
jgi:hypothetical protein